MKTIHIIAISVLALFAAQTLPASADEVPPSGSKSLSTILQSVEAQKLGAIAKAEFDDGLWEVKACQNQGCDKLYIDPATGETVHSKRKGPEEMPPAGALPVSEVVQTIESRNQGSITEVEFEHGHWEVKIRKGFLKTKLFINPMTGKELQ